MSTSLIFHRSLGLLAAGLSTPRALVRPHTEMWRWLHPRATRQPDRLSCPLPLRFLECFPAGSSTWSFVRFPPLPMPGTIVFGLNKRQEGRITSAPACLAGGIRATSTSFARAAAALVACQHESRHQHGSQQRQWQLPSQAEAATCQLPHLFRQKRARTS